jgi:hypothetical protein
LLIALRYLKLNLQPLIFRIKSAQFGGGIMSPVFRVAGLALRIGSASVLVCRQAAAVVLANLIS